MKKTILLLLLTTISVILCSCGEKPSGGPYIPQGNISSTIAGPKVEGSEEHVTEETEATKESGQVKVAPEQLILYDIRDKFGDLSYTATHHPDEVLHTDTVIARVVVAKKYYKEHYVGVLTYRYNKNSDTWDTYREAEWTVETTEYISGAYLGEWNGNFKGRGRFTVIMQSVDFEKNKVTGQFSASVTSMSLGGSSNKITLDVQGSYEIIEEFDGYKLEIQQSGYTFVFQLSKYYGVIGSTVYNTKTGYGVG